MSTQEIGQVLIYSIDSAHPSMAERRELCKISADVAAI